MGIPPCKAWQGFWPCYICYSFKGCVHSPCECSCLLAIKIFLSHYTAFQNNFRWHVVQTYLQMGKHPPCVNGKIPSIEGRMLRKGRCFQIQRRKNIGVLYESVINIGFSCFGLSQKWKVPFSWVGFFLSVVWRLEQNQRIAQHCCGCLF